MLPIRASRPDSLAHVYSGDPGSRGAMHARATWSPFEPSCRAYWLFACAHRIVSRAARGASPFLDLL